MDRPSKADVNKLIRKALDRCDYPVLDLPWARRGFTYHGKNQSVTPFFMLSQPRSIEAMAYQVQGSIGLLDLEFERRWAEESGNRGGRASLHILNFTELYEPGLLLTTESLEPQVAEFCGYLVKILNQFPRSRAEIRDALGANRLCGKPFEAYFALNLKELEAFKRYIAASEIH